MSNILPDSMMRYFVIKDDDLHYGLVITTVGSQSVTANQHYPPEGIAHPSGYYFSVSQGRVLQEYQLIYIVSGGGVLKIDEVGEFALEEGDLFMVYPGVRHRYYPNTKTGWCEYWIGFKGDIIESIVSKGFLKLSSPVFKIGHNERIIDLYKKVYAIASEEREGNQQALAGIVMHILGLAMYRHRTSNFEDNEVVSKIAEAKSIMRESLYNKVDLEPIATHLNMSYSNFRKTFKKVVGVSPLSYFNQMRIDEAKLLLSTTNLSIKEISFRLSYDSPEAFSVYFHKKVKVTPSQYRMLGFAKNGV
ncbi:MAG: AraC family transcriptional regulator [Rikenellaceae bacterium]